MGCGFVDWAGARDTAILLRSLRKETEVSSRLTDRLLLFIIR